MWTTWNKNLLNCIAFRLQVAGSTQNISEKNKNFSCLLWYKLKQFPNKKDLKCVGLILCLFAIMRLQREFGSIVIEYISCIRCSVKKSNISEIFLLLAFFFSLIFIDKLYRRQASFTARHSTPGPKIFLRLHLISLNFYYKAHFCRSYFQDKKFRKCHMVSSLDKSMNAKYVLCGTS